MGIIRDFALKSKEETLANGKIIMTNFKNLKIDDFKDFANNQKELEELMIACGVDGRMYINTLIDNHEAIKEAYLKIINESRYNLDQQSKTLRAILKGTYDDKERSHLELQGRRVYLMLIDAEKQRRQIEKKYYNACK